MTRYAGDMTMNYNYDLDLDLNLDLGLDLGLNLLRLLGVVVRYKKSNLLEVAWW